MTRLIIKEKKMEQTDRVGNREREGEGRRWIEKESTWGIKEGG